MKEKHFDLHVLEERLEMINSFREQLVSKGYNYVNSFHTNYNITLSLSLGHKELTLSINIILPIGDDPMYVNFSVATNKRRIYCSEMEVVYDLLNPNAMVDYIDSLKTLIQEPSY